MIKFTNCKVRLSEGEKRFHITKIFTNLLNIIVIIKHTEKPGRKFNQTFETETWSAELGREVAADGGV